MSDVDDDELAALRAAALASLNKGKPTSNSSVNPSNSNNVASISTVMASSSYSSYNTGDQPNYSSQYSWRNQLQNNRRGRGSRPFPKVSQRSNLIVITPVASEEKNSDGKNSSSQLVLPQHKWCQSINEDSSSPRSFKKLGPTRFNRHDSDSDSSDSEPELSDNDSYSNETILQDEPSDHYGNRSGRSISRESTPEKSISERRLSFQNIDSDSFPNLESTSVYKCLKNTHNKNDKKLELRSPSVENDTERSWKRGSDKKYPHTQSDVSDSKRSSHEDDSSKSLTANGEPSRRHKLSSVLSETEHSSRPQSEAYRDGSSSPKSNRSLTKNDLRLELKKRMHEMKQNLQTKRDLADRTRSSSRSPPNRSRRRATRSRSRSANGHRSRSVDRSHSRRRSHSPEQRRGRRTNHRQRKRRSPSLVPDRSKTEQACSPPRNSKRNRSSSSERSRKERSRSPHRRRGHSTSSDRSRKDKSHSPRPNRKRAADSPISDGSRKNRSHSPRPVRKRVEDSPISEGSRKNRSRSPRPVRKRVEDSPISEGSRKNWSRSPRPVRKRVGDSPISDRGRKNRSRSPHTKRRRDRSSSSGRSRKDQSRSPARNRKRGRSLSSEGRPDRHLSSPETRKSPTPSKRDTRRDRAGRHGRHRSRSFSSSESSDSSRHSSSAERVHSVSSVIKPVSVVSRVDPKEKPSYFEAEFEKPLVSSGKPSFENKNNASDGQKRVPVHMRLGSLPGKRVIQMTKDVEAAFVNTSSDEGGDESNGRHKKDSSRVMCKANDGKNDESSKPHRNVIQSDTFKEARFKHRR